jgi:hypothetical protein
MRTLARLTVDELREVVEDAVERKLTELLNDPDKGRKLRASIQRRLHQSLLVSRQGQRGIPASQIARKHGIKW